MKLIVNLWQMLSRPIYKGDRLKENLLALTRVSIATAILGLVLMVVDTFKHDNIMFLAATCTFVAGLGCAYCAGVLKNRELACIIPTVFCALMFTLYSATGLAEGTAMLWALLLPIGMCYFVSVKYGILLSIYHTLMYIVLFYTPLSAKMATYYTGAFMVRFPMLYGFLSLFTAIAMIQYHRMALAEIENTQELNQQLKEQRDVALERAIRLEAVNDEVVQTLAVAIDAKDNYTKGHSFRVSWYSMELARHLGWSEEEIKMLGQEALLHDIGKIGVPDKVLNKPGRLTDEEFSIIKSHTLVGSGILLKMKSLGGAAEVARHHHERYDGWGYPDKLSGKDIPVHARIVAIADAYDAMRSDRVYRKGLPMDIIHRELIQGKGSQFDPDFLDVFLRLSQEGALDEIAGREISIFQEMEVA